MRKWYTFILLCITSLIPSVLLAANTDVLRTCVEDLVKQSPERQLYTRYLYYGNVPKPLRDDVAKILGGHVNQLSQEPYITLPVQLPNNVLRIYLKDYRWSKELWESLAQVDPYYHVQAFQEGKDGEGNTKPIKEKVILLAPQLSKTLEDKGYIVNLVKYSQSQIPLVNAAWFFNQTVAQVDRNPGYYEFLGKLKSEGDFQKLVGFDKNLAHKRGGPLRAAVSSSGVAKQPRAIARMGVVDGGYWYTLDMKLAVGRANPLINTTDNIEDHFDATEQYGHLPNGLWAMFLADNKGLAQASAPDFVGKDSTSKSNDGRIHVPISCIRCHGSGGLRDIDDWVRNMIETPFSANLLNPKSLQEEINFRRAYTRSVTNALNSDKNRYELAIKEATSGWDSKTFAQKASELWEWFEDGEVDIRRASHDLECTVPEFKYALTSAAKAGVGHPVLSIFLQKDERIRTVPIRQWLEALPQAHELLARYPVP